MNTNREAEGVALKMILKYESCDALDVMSMFATAAKAFQSNEEWYFVGEVRKWAEISDATKGKKAFSFGSAACHFRFISMPPPIGMDVLEIRARSDKEDSAEAWREAMSWCGSRLVMARLFDADYEYWQNVTDPLVYQAAGRDYSDLPMCTNGLPPPLRRNRIDISGNPGRVVPRSGFEEGVASTMYFGAAFWSVVPTTPNAIERIGDVQLSGDHLMVTTQREVFRSAIGEEGERQRILRAALFAPGGESE